MFLPTFPPSVSTSDPLGGTNVRHRHHRRSRPAPGRSTRFIPRSASASSTSASRRSAAPSSRRRQPSSPRTARSARSRARVRVENLVTEEPALDRAPAQRGLLRRRLAPRAGVREHVRRAERGRQPARQRPPRRFAASPCRVELVRRDQGAGEGPDGNFPHRHRRHRRRSTAPTGASRGTLRSPAADSPWPSASRSPCTSKPA